MNIAPDAQLEAERLSSLAHYDILDSLPEQEYDDITLMASHICQMPISLISFVDHDRQWFKSRTGPVQDQVRRDISLCAYAIRNPWQMLIVPDASRDERFADNPLICNTPYIRFYAGMPLTTPEGHALGTLCVIDTKPSYLSDLQTWALAALARQVIALLDLRKQKKVLEQALAKEHELQTLKSEFVNMVSHQLRTPLTTISTSTDLIELYLKKLTAVDMIPFERHIGLIREGIDNFTDLLNGVFTVGQIGAGKLSFSPHPVDVVALCEDLITGNFMHRPDGRQVQLIIESPPVPVYLDTKLITHALLNLLTNAFKFSERDPELRLCFEPSRMVLSVVDEGIGIPKRDMPNLFDSFYRASNASMTKGTGLGLMIARQFVEIHGGTIQIESREHHGTTVRVCLPYQPALPDGDEIAAPRRERSRRPLKKTRP